MVMCHYKHIHKIKIEEWWFRWLTYIDARTDRTVPSVCECCQGQSGSRWETAQRWEQRADYWSMFHQLDKERKSTNVKERDKRRATDRNIKVKEQTNCGVKHCLPSSCVIMLSTIVQLANCCICMLGLIYTYLYEQCRLL